MTITLNITTKLGDEVVKYLMRQHKITAEQAVTGLIHHGLTVVREMDQDFNALCERIEWEHK